MQIKALHKNVYKLYAYTRTQETLDALRSKHETRTKHWERLKSEGLSDAACGRIAGFSRASYYRSRAALEALKRGKTPPSKVRKRQNKPRWGEKERQLILAIRRENPTYGKDKIAVILKRDHDCPISASTVGRILNVLKTKGLITASPSCRRTKRTRNFQGRHATPWKYKQYTTMQLGERVQIDHMTATKNGVTVKHFQAWERQSKHIHAQIYSHAKSTAATKFLRELIAVAPYEITSIQVDGGSEFRAEFEKACAELHIPLIVLPPSKPAYNGGVERGNRTFREEFYDKKNILADSIGALRYDLRNAVTKYNHYRPHKTLDGQTPNEYIQQTLKQAA